MFPPGFSHRRWLSPAFVALTLAVVLVLASCHGFFTNPILTSVRVTPSNPNVTIGSTQQFTGTGVNDDGSTSNVTVTWTSSNATVATITSSGLATAVAAGTSTITATTGSISGTTAMNVVTSALTAINVTAASTIVAVRSTDQLTATATFADSTTKDVTSSVTWTSSNNGIATVDASGLVTGVAAGQVTITATSGNISGQITLTVQ